MSRDITSYAILKLKKKNGSNSLRSAEVDPRSIVPRSFLVTPLHMRSDFQLNICLSSFDRDELDRNSWE